MEENKDREFASDVKVVVTEVQADMDRNNVDMVKKLTFFTNVGNITFKPTTKREEYRDGIKMMVTSSAYWADLPVMVKEISKKISTDGKCEVKATYSVWHTEVDDNPMTYRFVQGNNMMAKWHILAEEKPLEEEVK